MDQWFIKIDHENFRQQALAAINEVNWVPGWGQNRIEGAVEGRPDWCISRQRTWGVPIPAFYAGTEPILDARIVRNTAALIEEHGSNVWFERDTAALWADVKPTDWEGPEPDGKSMDTLDVWIDSGSSSRSVIMHDLSCIMPKRKAWRTGKPMSISREATSIAVGSKARCCFRSPAMARRRSKQC